jgi:SAM-dependent methyltransferase
MRDDVLAFARDVAENFEIGEPLVEMGSRAAEGQEDIADVRPIFRAGTHIGCDIQPGLGVDRIEDIHNLTFEDNSVGTVIALETLEHVADPLRAVQEMHRVLRPGGLLAISSLMFFPIHAHPWDYWRFTPEGFDLILRPFESRLVLAVGHPLVPEGVFGIGIKGPASDLGPHRLPRTRFAGEHWAQNEIVDFGVVRMSVRTLWGHTLRYSVKAAQRRAARLRNGVVRRISGNGLPPT